MKNKNISVDITIKDIASEAGSSIATVSRALTGEKWVRQETRERILAIARRLNYHANLRARGLVAKKADGIEIIIPQTSEYVFSNPFYAEALKGMGEKSRESGQYLIISLAREETYTRIYLHGLTAGIIILVNRIDDQRLDEARKIGVPIVLIPGFPNKQNIPSVDANNIDGAFRAVDYLASLGHRRIAFINGHMKSKYSIDRLVGYCKALEKNHLAFYGEFIWEGDFTQQSCYEGMRKLLSMPQSPTAVLVINDFGALGALKATKEMAFRVPEDVSIVGFGDVPFSSMIIPALTTVREPYREMGYEAVSMLLKIIQGKRLSKKSLILPVELVIRDSAAPPLNRKRKKMASG